MRKLYSLLVFLFLIVITINAQNWQHIDTVGFNWFSTADDFAVAGPGEIWFGNNEANSPLTYYDDGNITNYDSASYPFLPGDISDNLTIDNEGSLWFTADNFSGDDDERIVRFDGSSFTVFDSSTTHQSQYFVADISVDSQNNIYFTDNQNITVFDGSTWETTNYRDLVQARPGFGEIEFDAHNNKWVATELGIYVLNNDNSFEIYDTNNGLKSQFISDIEFDSEGNIWVATRGGGVAKANSDFTNVTVWDSTNSQIAVGGDFNTARAVEIDNNGIVWVGHETGVASYDGSDWTYYNSDNSPLPTYDGETQLVMDIQVDANNNKYFLTLFNNVFIFNESIINDLDSDESIPASFKLAQNYPNPFNPSTTISYSVPKKSNVSLIVYDVLGKEVAELVNSEKSAGSYEVDFNGESLSSGIYFYTLKTSNSVLTKKMMLIK